MSNLKVGDIVKIGDLGESYTTNSCKMKSMGFKDHLSSRCNYVDKLEALNEEDLYNINFKVFAINSHYVGIEDFLGNQLLIGQDGLLIEFVEINGWYVHKNKNHVNWLKYVDFDKNICYGFNESNEWSNDMGDFDSTKKYIGNNCELANIDFVRGRLMVSKIN